MKRTIFLLILSFAFMQGPCVADDSLLSRELTPGERAEIQSDGTALRKLQRGFLNTVLSPFEISNELQKETRTETMVPSFMWGLLRGGTYALARSAVGIYEMLTFPFPIPAEYEPIIQPEFPWELLPDRAYSRK